MGKRTGYVAVAYVLVAAMALVLVGCTGTVSNVEQSATSTAEYDDYSYDDGYAQPDYDYLLENRSAPSYEDSRWPTANPELLAVPESNRYYNAWDSQNTNCTIVGPVVNVYWASDENGQPVFIDIGEPYGSANNVSLVVWNEMYDDFADMIDDVSKGGAWLSVSGYLSVYNGSLQFNPDDGPIEYRWWTGVR